MRRCLMSIAIGLFLTGQAAAQGVDASTLTGKVMCGYQGWFNAPADGAGRGWVHWGRGAMRPGAATVDLWPDVSELAADERFATGFHLKDGRAAEVYSAAVPATVARHFRWMREYGIDGVWLQRFASEIGTGAAMRHDDRVLANVRAGAMANGRVYGLMYDLSGRKDEQLDRVLADWRRLVAETRLSEDAAYIHDGGRPVVALWGVGFGDGRDPLLGDGARRLIGGLHEGGCRVLLGVPTGWRTMDADAVRDPRLLEVIGLADVVCPWTVGRYADLPGVGRHAARRWAPDVQWCRQHGKGYLPVVFPGFSWHNLQAIRGKASPTGQIPRLGGRFLAAQYAAAQRAGATMVYQAMFDEVDEGTAIFKCAADVPVDGQFLTYEGLSADFYLRLVGRATRMVRGEIKPDELQP